MADEEKQLRRAEILFLAVGVGEVIQHHERPAHGEKPAAHAGKHPRRDADGEAPPGVLLSGGHEVIRGQHEKEHAEHALEKRLIHCGGEVDGGGGGRGVDDEREDDLARADVLSVAQYHQRRQRDAHDAHDGGGLTDGEERRQNGHHHNPRAEAAHAVRDTGQNSYDADGNIIKHSTLS